MSSKSIFPQKLKNIYHLGQAILANLIYGFPSRRIKVVGVTGTNGKTTTVQMIGKILEEAGHKIALASTINFKLGEKEWVNKTKFTTLSPFAVQKFISQSVKTGCQYLVLETSSHSLDQNRVWGIRYDTAVITNITREHLDYHKTMVNYQKAKLKLFEKNVKTAVVNLDMENPEEFLQFDNEVKYGYTTQVQNSKFKIQSRLGGTKIKIIKAENIELGINNSSYKLQATSYKLNLPGLFNIENALAATCVGLSQNISLEKISASLEKIKGIPGRMEYVPNILGLNIIIDYAVTPDSLEKLYDLIKNIRTHSQKLAPNLHVISVFGACGERDRGKRPMMGEIVSRYADYIVVTNEDPYNEDPVQIIDEVSSGIISKITNNQDTRNKQIQNFPLERNPAEAATKLKILENSLSSTSSPLGRGWPERPGEGKIVEGVNVFRILDRREAIKKALQIAKPGDFVVVTGKGAEETMAVGNKRIPWNDKKVIQALLKE